MKNFTASLIIISLLLSACSPGRASVPTIDPVAAGVSATQAVRDLVATMMAGITPTATPTELPTPTPSATPTAVPVFASADTNVVCRLGPYISFDKVESLSKGDTAEIIGQLNTNGNWWKVKLSSGSECWLSADLVTVNEDTSQVVFFDSPPTPTPKPLLAWNGTWSCIWGPWPSGDYGVQPCTITINISGDKLIGSLDTDWGRIILSGQANSSKPSEISVSLTDELGHVIYAVLYRDQDSSNQFRGHVSSSTWTVPICGSRGGSPLPDPCMK